MGVPVPCALVEQVGSTSEKEGQEEEAVGVVVSAGAGHSKTTEGLGSDAAVTEAGGISGGGAAAEAAVVVPMSVQCWETIAAGLQVTYSKQLTLPS